MGSSKFKEYKGLDLSQINREILEQWDRNDAFHQSITTREGHPTFVFYEGPPSANGTPGMSFRKMRRISFSLAPFTFLTAISLRRRFTSSLV